MNKLLAAALAAAFSLSVAATAMAAPAQVNQRHSKATEVQSTTPSDQRSMQKSTTKKKKVAKKSSSKKKVAKKGQKKQMAQKPAS
jgi:organic hydroperoxide reductase OsmC/OhrA